MSGRRGTMAGVLLSGLLAVGVADATPVGAQAAEDAACLSCHAEPELLRSRSETRAEALALHVDPAALAASAHPESSCSECHTGYAPYPHRATARTEGCADCHEEAQTLWADAIHALPAEDAGGTDGAQGDAPAASCAQCHGVHDVGFVSDTLGPVDPAPLTAACTSCHVERAIPPEDPHGAPEVGCFGCHAPHDTRAVEDPAARVAPTRQADHGCLHCHEDQVVEVRADAHFNALQGRPFERTGASPEVAHDPPSCTGCHGGHDLVGPTTQPAMNQADVCGACHEEFVDSFSDSYHGQATALGSEVAADCSDCHTGHSIFATHDARSAVSEERLVDTCAECHEGAGASFVLFQPHANHHDREKYPYVWWSYRLMTGLLVGVFGVFGMHTLLWLGRLTAAGIRGPVEERSDA